MGLRLEIKIPSLDKFYEESNIVEDTGSKSEWELCNKRDDRSWVGLSHDEVAKSMYSYKEGLDKLAAIELDVPLGGSKKIYKWDDEDFVFALISAFFPFATIWIEKKYARFDRED